MDAVGKVVQVALTAAHDEDDLQAMLPLLMAVTGDATVLHHAVEGLNRELQHHPHDAHLRRARALLVGALTTPAYRTGLGSRA